MLVVPGIGRSDVKIGPKPPWEVVVGASVAGSVEVPLTTGSLVLDPGNGRREVRIGPKPPLEVVEGVSVEADLVASSGVDVTLAADSDSVLEVLGAPGRSSVMRVWIGSRMPPPVLVDDSGVEVEDSGKMMPVGPTKIPEVVVGLGFLDDLEGVGVLEDVVGLTVSPGWLPVPLGGGATTMVL